MKDAMNTEPQPFVSAAQVPDARALQVRFRPEEHGDRRYILGCWSRGWRKSLDCRWMTDSKYHYAFQDLISGPDGVLHRRDTKVLVGCSPDDRSWVWSFCVFTPGKDGGEPVIHWTHVRPTLRDQTDHKRRILRLGIATRMLAAGGDLGPGVVDRLTYTCRPGIMTMFPVLTSDDPGLVEAAEQEELRATEAAFHEAAKKNGVSMSFRPLATWMRGGR